MPRRFVSTKEDFSIKSLLANETVRRYFISAVIGVPVEEIRRTRLLNPFFRKRYRRQKLGIADVLAELNDDTKLNIELQVARCMYWDRRSLFYMAKMYTEDLWSGEDYRRLKRSVSISILDFDLTEDEDCHKVYYLRDEKGRLFSDVFEVHTIELRKQPREGEPLEEWVMFFNAKSKEELDMIQTRNPGILEAIREVKSLGLGRMARMWYEEGLKEKRDIRAREEYVREEGREEERVNTQKAEERARQEKERADQMEEENRRLQEELELYRRKG